ncbi:MAG: NAD(P)-binding domain-containing protein [Actinomycetota bacterium]
MPTSPTSAKKVCILGAGPHGLAAAVHLRRADPDLDIVTVDPSGEWLTGWHEQFARAEIDALRSPIVHHPAPDPYALSDFVTERKLARSGLPYDPPTTVAFGSFCRDLAEASGLPAPLAGRVEAVRRDDRGLQILTEGAEIRADNLVVATNPHRRSIPEWVWPLLGSQPGLIAYGSDVDLRTTPDLQGRRVVIVGGGLTAAHLACGAAARGAEVTMVTRRALETRDFDTEPGWLGPRFLTAFGQDDDPASRLRTALQARGGGTVPPWMRARLNALVGDGRLALSEDRCIRAADVDQDGACVLALDDQTTLVADHVWLATGTTPDLVAARCLADLVADVPAVGGLPVTDENLRLGPHPIHVMGRLAILTLGPAAGNLWGAQRAAMRITRALTGIDLQHRSMASVPPPGRSSTPPTGRR